MGKIVKYAFMNSIGTAIYVAAIASFIYFLGNSGFPDSKTVFIPIAMLMLFVFSAAFTGSLVFGRPIIWYLDGKKKEALQLLFNTLILLLMMALVFFIIMIMVIK